MANRTADATRHLSEVEAAWMGALIEGEGTISRRNGIPMTIEVSSVEVETVATCLRLTGAGTVEYISLESLSRHGAMAKQSQWRWRLHGIENIRAVLRAIWSFLTSKQELALECLSVPLPRLGSPIKERCRRDHLYVIVSGRKVCRQCQASSTRRWREGKQVA